MVEIAGRYSPEDSKIHGATKHMAYPSEIVEDIRRNSKFPEAKSAGALGD
jgi:hypothetical protein